MTAFKRGFPGLPTELDTARAIAAGDLPSPQKLGNSALFAIRITGTGIAVRGAPHNETAFRDPADYLTDEFVARCNGLPVIWEHPEGSLLTSGEYADRNVGSCILPYVQGQEVWAVARILDASAITLMSTGEWSSSPCIVPARGTQMDTAEGVKLVIEGEPMVVDHIAIVANGVWDKGGAPSGVRADAISTENTAMSETKEKTEGDPLAQIMAALGGITTRLDGLEEHVNTQKSASAAAEAEKARIASEKAKGTVSDVPTNDEDNDDSTRAALADAQMRADSVANSFGQQADKPMVGETPRNYRIRQLRRFQPHSKDFKETNLRALDDPTLDAVERVVYADAMVAARNPLSGNGRGQLIEIKRKDSVGRMVSEFFGDPKVWMDEFSMQPYALTRINTPGNRDD